MMTRRSSVVGLSPRRLVLASLGAVLLAPRLSAASTTTLRLGGTGMALAITRILVERFAGLGEVLVDPQVLTSLGTSGGLAALRRGHLDLALSARALTAAEEAAGLSAVAFARTPNTFATRPDTRTESVTLALVERIMAGGMMQWSDGAPLRLVRRDRSESDWVMLASLSAGMAQAVERALARPGLATVGTDQENADLLEQIPGSFGMISLGQILSERRRLRPLALDGVVPTPAAMADGRYPFARSLFLVTRADAAEVSVLFRGFLGHAIARRLMVERGYQPLLGDAA